MKMYVYLLLLLLFIINLNLIFSHFCGIDLLKKPKRVLVHQENDNQRHLKEESWESLRIHLDFSMIENNVGKFSKQDLLDLKEKIMPKTKSILEKLLKVKRVNGKLKLPATTCDNIPIPDIYHTEGVDADLVIFVLIDDSGFFTQNHVEAAAIHCFQHEVTRRPIAGYIQFKPDLKVVDNKTALDYMVWLSLHEITHILVMNEALYEDWMDADLKPLGLNNVIGSKLLQNGKKMTFFKTPKILEKGREHFGCPTFEGLPLEYNGGPGTTGAHWAKKAMNTDYMIGDSYGENLISELTLAMFEDSGWYKTDYKLSNLFLWGKNSGCDFFNQKVKCVETDKGKITTKFPSEFCTKLNYPICSTSNIFRANCRTRRYKILMPYEQYFGDASLGGVDLLTDKCPIPIETKQGQTYYGGSCRVGESRTVNKFEKVCPECSCFLANLKEEGAKRSADVNQEDIDIENEDFNSENNQEEVKYTVKSRRLRFKQVALDARVEVPSENKDKATVTSTSNNTNSNSTNTKRIQTNSTQANNETEIIPVIYESNITWTNSDDVITSTNTNRIKNNSNGRNTKRIQTNSTEANNETEIIPVIYESNITWTNSDNIITSTNTNRKNNSNNTNTKRIQTNTNSSQVMTPPPSPVIYANNITMTLALVPGYSTPEIYPSSNSTNRIQNNTNRIQTNTNSSQVMTPPPSPVIYANNISMTIALIPGYITPEIVSNLTDGDDTANRNLTTPSNDLSIFEGSLSNKIKAIGFKRDPLPKLNPDDFRSYCFQYKCQPDGLYVMVLDKAYKCNDKTPIAIKGFTGVIQCPPTNVLCHEKYKCKFGCTEKYSNDNPK